MSEKDQEASVPPDKQEHLSTILRGLQEQQITPSGTIEASAGHWESGCAFFVPQAGTPFYGRRYAR